MTTTLASATSSHVVYYENRKLNPQDTHRRGEHRQVSSRSLEASGNVMVRDHWAEADAGCSRTFRWVGSTARVTRSPTGPADVSGSTVKR